VKIEKPLHDQSGNSVNPILQVSSSSQRLKTADSAGDILEKFEQSGEPGQLESRMDIPRNICQHHFATIEALAVTLGSNQGAESGAGHIFEFLHIDDNLEAALIGNRIERFRQFGRSRAIYTAFDGYQITMFELLGCNFHRSSVANKKVSFSTIAKT
jgi:hypothetical protein